MYEKKYKLKNFSRIYKTINIKYNNILLKNKPFLNYINNLYICYQIFIKL